MTGVGVPTPVENTDGYLMEMLRKASDHDPNRLHTEMWPVIEELAAREGIEIPRPKTTRSMTLRITARFPESRDFEAAIAGRIHAVIADEFMEGGTRLGMDGPLVEMLMIELEDL